MRLVTDILYPKDAASGVANVAQLFQLSDRALPSAPDGLTDAQAAPAYEERVDTPALTARVVDGIKAQVRYLLSRVPHIVLTSS